ncbi:hypothetical protein LRY65_05160 [Candidatus Woesebacteria bacterium]|nr:hypothetical protein [Candidatus Woesebacteria bacterium]MCD8506825.1 hypothetical protein [Candidatus Woesebacteria bacterium]MCD8527557.1 hypothetical protein [Candidatus Woesebacteria bacterium]MCD8546297.1 hypothetical protein [Candidatus Woesebacteria bacterium]
MNKNQWYKYLVALVIAFGLVIGTGFIYARKASNTPGMYETFMQRDMAQEAEYTQYPEASEGQIDQEMSEESDLDALEADLNNTVILDEDFSDL